MSKRILIADDEECIRDVLSIMCSKLGFESDCVCDGNAAFVLMNSMDGKYEAVLLDLNMPDWNGLDVLETYHGRGKHIVIVSGKVDEKLRTYLDSHPHVKGVLLKPFSMKELKYILKGEVDEEDDICPLNFGNSLLL